MRVCVGDVRLFFDVEGARLAADGPRFRERPCVLFLPGGPGQEHSIFKPAFDPLSEVAQLIYLDPRGCGRSDPGHPDHWCLATWADDVARLCDALEIEHPILLGASFGGMVALEFAGAHPGRAEGLVLAMTGLGLRPGLASAAFGRLHGTAARSVHDGYWQQPGPATFAEYMRVCVPLYSRIHASPDEATRGRRNDALLERYWGGEMRTVDLTGAASRVSCPALVLVGELDPLLPPAASEELVAALPPGVGRLHVLPEAGHGTRDLVASGALDLIRAFVLEDVASVDGSVR
jgi:proline iminopeptidase